MGVYERCVGSAPDGTCGCGGEVAVGLTTDIRVNALNEDGSVMVDGKGQPVKVVLRLPKHVLPREVRESKLVTADRLRAAQERAAANEAAPEPVDW